MVLGSTGRRWVYLGLAGASLLNLALASSERGNLLPAACLMSAVAVLLYRAARPQEGPTRPEHFSSVDHLITLAVFALALIARFYWLEFRPPSPNLDEGINGGLIAGLLSRTWQPGPVLDRAVPGEEALFFYLHAFSFSLFGPTMLAFRLPAALLGACCPVLLFWLFRRLARRLPAALAALLAAIDPTLCHFSRQANTIIYPAVFEAGALLFMVRALSTGRLADFLGMGLMLGVGLHTYPAFRIVPPILLTILALGCWLSRRTLPGRLMLGWLLTFVVTVTFFSPFVQDASTLELYAGRLTRMTTAGMSLGEAFDRALQRVPDVAGIFLGVEPYLEGFVPLPRSLVPLTLLGALALFLAGRRSPPRPQPALRGAVGPWGRAPAPAGSALTDVLTVALISLALLPPLVVHFEAAAARRFLLGIVPLYVWLALGLDRLWTCLTTGRRGLVLMAAFLALIAAEFSDLNHSLVRMCAQIGLMPQQERLLRAAANLAPDRQIVVSRSTVRYPFLTGQMGMAPNLSFLLNNFGVVSVLGLNLFPVFPSWADVSYVLGKDEWQKLLEETFPGGRHEHWEGPAGSGCQLDLYTVSRREAHSFQGLYLSSGLDVNTSPDLLVSGLNMPGIALQPGRGYRWTGALYLHDMGMWDFRFEGTRNAILSIGDRTASSSAESCGLSGWFPEGWQSFSARATAPPTAVGPVSFSWRPPGITQLREVPSEAFLRKLPANAIFRARPVVEPGLSVARVRYRYWLEPEIGGRTQDMAFVNTRVYLLGHGPNPILCLDLDGAPVRSWKGLRDQQDRPIELPPTRGFLRFGYSLATAPDGTLFLADCYASRLLFIRPDGQLARLVTFADETHRLSGIAYDTASSTVMVADSLTGQILRFGPDGEPKPGWGCFGATSLCSSPDGQRIYVTTQRRGGIAVLSAEGKEIDFWRAVDVTALSRMTCDPRGNLYVIVEGNRLLGFTPEGRILVRMEVLPDPLPAHESKVAFKLAIRPLDAHELLIGLGGVASGFGVVELQQPPLSPGAPSLEAVPVSGPPQPKQPSGQTGRPE